MRVALTLALLAAAACGPRTEPVLTFSGDDGPGADVDQVTDELPADADTPNPSLCTFAGIALCDGFEQPQVQSPPWYFVNIAASVTLDTERFYRGGRSLHVRTDVEPDPVQPTRQGEITQIDAVPQDTLFGRVFMYAANPPPAWTYRIWGVLQPDAPNLGPSLLVEDGKLAFASPDVITHSAQVLPLDRWVCLEWKVVSGVAGEMQLWLDGNEVSDLHYFGDTTRSPAVGRFSIGVALFGDALTRPAFDIWFDELGLDDERIGCTR